MKYSERRIKKTGNTKLLKPGALTSFFSIYLIKPLTVASVAHTIKALGGLAGAGLILSWFDSRSVDFFFGLFSSSSKIKTFNYKKLR